MPFLDTLVPAAVNQIRTLQARPRPQQTTPPAATDWGGVVQGIQLIAGGAIAVCQGLDLIERSCPGVCVPNRDNVLLR